MAESIDLDFSKESLGRGVRKPKWRVREEREAKARARAIEEVMEARGVDATTVEEVMDIVSGGEEEERGWLLSNEVIPQDRSAVNDPWLRCWHPLVRHVAYMADRQEDDRFATLMALLIKFSCLIPHSVVLPNLSWNLEGEFKGKKGVKRVGLGGGGCQPYNLYGMLIGKSGSGKTSLISHLDGIIYGLDVIKQELLGSGEGVLEYYKKPRKTEIDGKIVIGEYEWVNRSGFWVKDEGSGLLTLDSRENATLGSLLLEMYSGVHVGFNNRKDSPKLAAMGYRCSLLSGTQLSVLAKVLAKKDVGFPQRIVWALAVGGWGKRDREGLLWNIEEESGELVVVDLRDWNGGGEDRPLRLGVGDGWSWEIWDKETGGGKIDALLVNGDLIELDGVGDGEVYASMIYEEKVRGELLRIQRLGKVADEFLEGGTVRPDDLEAHRAGLLGKIAGLFALARGSMKVQWKDLRLAMWVMELSDSALRKGMEGVAAVRIEANTEAGVNEAERRAAAGAHLVKVRKEELEKQEGLVLDWCLELALRKEETEKRMPGEIMGSQWVRLRDLTNKLPTEYKADKGELTKETVRRLCDRGVMRQMGGERMGSGERRTAVLVRVVKGMDCGRKVVRRGRG